MGKIGKASKSALGRIFGVGGDSVATNVTNKHNSTFTLIISSEDSEGGIKDELFVSGYMTADINMSITPKWGEPFFVRTFEEFNRFLSTASAVGSAMGASAPSKAVLSTLSTVSRFQGMNKISISIPYIFVTLDNNDDPIAQLKKFIKLATPASVTPASQLTDQVSEGLLNWSKQFNLNLKTSKAAGFFKVYSAPLNYTPADKKGGKIALRIGHWLVTPSWFICKNVTYTVVKESTKTLKPLFITGTLELETYRILDSDETLKMFKMAEDVRNIEIKEMQERGLG